jgi:hypothetical protein
LGRDRPLGGRRDRPATRTCRRDRFLIALNRTVFDVREKAKKGVRDHFLGACSYRGAFQTETMSDHFFFVAFLRYPSLGETFPSNDLRSPKGLDVAAAGLSSALRALTPV